jgi:hypothetical protein
VEDKGGRLHFWSRQKIFASVMVVLPGVTEEGGLVQAFAKEGRVQYALPTSPFQDETEEDEMRRFAPHVKLMSRHKREGGKKRNGGSVRR